MIALSDMLAENRKVNNRRPLTPWELPTLLTPLYRYGQVKNKKCKDRQHFPAILSFVYRNRFAVASQIQRRFPDTLRSDRTTRRHLEEMQQLGYLGLAPTSGTSPLWPKVYFVTGRGVKRLQNVMAARGREWKPTHIDRRSRHTQQGYSSDRVVHEILLTEFLLAVWQTANGRPDLELLTVQRRSLARHPAFRIVVDQKQARLAPDALFLFRQKEGGMIASLVELDTGTMSLKQMKRKLSRYQAWSQSEMGQKYLVELYRQNGATNPQANFRLLFVCDDRSNTGGEKRVRDLFGLSLHLARSLRERIWFTSIAKLREAQDHFLPLGCAIWYRVKDARNWIDEVRSTDVRKQRASIIEQRLSEATPHSIFPS